MLKWIKNKIIKWLGTNEILNTYIRQINQILHHNKMDLFNHERNLEHHSKGIKKLQQTIENVVSIGADVHENTSDKS